MNVSHEPRLAPPEGLRNGCGLHISSPPKQTVNVFPSSPPPMGAAAGGRYQNNSHPYYFQKHHQLEQRSNLHDEVMQMFDKCFVYQKPTDTDSKWSLPSSDVLFTEYYQLDNMQKLKTRLNEVKSKLNDYVIEEWSQHTRRKDPSGEIPWRLKSETKAEFVTIGWCKLFECLGRFPSLAKGPHMNSLHLCEAPGAFMAALNHYLHSKYDKDEIQWNWLATTLNPYYEGNPVKKMIMDERFMLYTLNNWLFHKDFTGNIIDKENLLHMKQQCLERLGEVHLITADGSIDCIDAPDCQEEKVAILHFAEIITALEILAEGGSFVVKMFTLYEASSLCKMYLLNCAFEKIHIYKPCTSKRGNSEVYVVCLNYQRNCKNLPEIIEKMREKLTVDNGMTMRPLFPKICLPSDFLMKHEIMCRLFMNYQITAIESNIMSYKIKLSKNSIKRLQALRSYVCDEYFRRYKVKSLPEELKILYKYQGNIEKSYKTQIYHGSHSEREMLKETTREEQIFKLRKHLNDLERMLTDSYDSEQTVKEFMRSEANSSLDLKLYRGKTLEVLHSSLFANVHLLVMRSKLSDFHDHDSLWHNNPRIEFPDQNFVLNFDDFITTPPNFAQQQELFFKSLIENLCKLKPNLIKFINMAFLTHYAASVLRYLSVTAYEQLIFKFHDTFEIQLKKSTPDFLTSVKKLNKAFLSSDETDQNILCFIDILELHHNDFNKTLISFNNMLLLQHFKSILDN